jgi:hypothetical protein
MKSWVDFQKQQQQHMQQQIVELLARPTFPTHQQEKPSDYDHKRDTPTTPTAMTNSPDQAQRKKANSMAPHNLMDSLSQPKQIHHTPTRYRSLTVITKTAQGLARHSPIRKPTTTSTSYAKETTGGIKK